MARRSCLGCGVKRPKKELLRMVVGDNRLKPDVSQRKPGRGAYICYQPACLTQGLKRKRMELALRRSIRPEEGEGLRQEAMSQLQQGILDLLHQVGKAGALSFPTNPGPARKKTDARCRAFIARDLSAARTRRLARRCLKLGIGWQLMGNKEMFLSISHGRSARWLVLAGEEKCQKIDQDLARLNRLSRGESSL